VRNGSDDFLIPNFSFLLLFPSVLLFHRDLGGAGKPPLVILHGFLGSSRNWQTAGRDLAERFHVFALDLRNHGSSPHTDEMGYAALVDDVLAWLERNRLERPVLLGHSMGGKVAMRLACRHPGRLRHLVVVDIAPKDYHWKERPVELGALNALDLTQLASRAEAERQLEPAVADWAARKFYLTNLERTADEGWRWQVNLPVLTATVGELEKNSLAADDRYAGPALFVLGGRSRYVQAADTALIQQHFPAAKIATLAESGHNPHMEMRTEFVHTVLAEVPDSSEPPQG
jgi:pimeloyl-ACP methyl ester carboxylesterase